MRVAAIIGLLVVACTPAPELPTPPMDASVPGHDSGVATLDAGLVDAAVADASTVSPDAGSPTTARAYTTDRAHSPLTADVADRLMQISAAGVTDDRVFAKVGDSITKSRNFLHCFAGPHVDLDGEDTLLSTVDHFRQGDVAGTDPFSRESVASVVGWSASAANAGSPSPAMRELDASSPTFAVVMFGSNDVGADDVYGYADDMFDLVDALTARGTIPILSSIPPRDDSATVDARVPQYNAVVRGLAQARKLPFIDLHRSLSALGDHGLGPDGVHPTVHRTSGGARGCIMTPVGLEHGYNVRNLLTVEALHRVKRLLVDGEPAPDDGVLRPDGEGTAAAPYVIGALPFADLRDTTTDGATAIDSYPGCNAQQDESGREVIYRLELDRAARVRAMVMDRGDVDIDVHLLGAAVDGAGCVERDHRSVVVDLAAGLHHFSLDTFVSAGGSARAGEYLFVVVAE